MKKTLTAFCVAALVVSPVSSIAQNSWPNKPIKAVVPFAAAAATDVVARTILEQLSRQLGQPIIVENKPGAGGTIGAAAVAHAPPDGYTLLIHSNSHTVAPATYKRLSYDAKKDLTGVIPLASVPMVMVTSPQSGDKSLADLVARAKASPGSINYVSAGTGGATHLGAERLLTSADFQAVHVPTKGTGEALTEVMSGRVDFYFAPVGFALPHVKTGKIVPLAVSSSKRSSGMPDIPTSVEAGFPNSEYDVWIGMFVPAGTPAPIIERLNSEAAKAIRSPEVQEKFRTLVMDEMIMPVEQFGKFLAQEFQMNADLVTKAGIQPN